MYGGIALGTFCNGTEVDAFGVVAGGEGLGYMAPGGAPKGLGCIVDGVPGVEEGVRLIEDNPLSWIAEVDVECKGSLMD